jgi:hypothetical protein
MQQLFWNVVLISVGLVCGALMARTLHREPVPVLTEPIPLKNATPRPFARMLSTQADVTAKTSEYYRITLATPPCAFNLSRVRVLKDVEPSPSIGIYSETALPESLVFHVPPTRMACPYERAVALYGDERVMFSPGKLYDEGSTGSTVSVCDKDGASNCVVVYMEPAK